MAKLKNAPVALIIMDGCGLGDKSDKNNAVQVANTPVLDGLLAKYKTSQLQASGEYVGLPDGQMGNSEVGHTNIGAGRIIYQQLTRITRDIKNGDFFKNEALLDIVNGVKANNGALHLLGLVSPGGVHSHQDHLYALLELAKKNDIKEVYVHAFLDGRDVPPQSAQPFLEELEAKCKEIGVGCIATISGRYYAMDKEARGINADLARYCYYLPKVLDGQKVEKPLIEDANLSALYDEAVREYQKTVAAQKEELPADVHYLDMTDIAPEDILPAILSKYKGKAVLIDVWATWCGPCRMGHKLMAPLKEELKGKDIEFVYITSPSSPYEDWKNMIGDIPGNHYYLTKGQYNHLLDLYHSNGIPTYAIYDTSGKQTYTEIGFPGVETIKEEIEKALNTK